MRWLRSGLAKSIQVWRKLIWGNSFKGIRRTEEPKKKGGMLKQPAGRHYHLQTGGTQDTTRTQKRLGRLPSKARTAEQEVSGGSWNPGEGRHCQTHHLKGWGGAGRKWPWNLLSACPSVFCSQVRKMEFAGSAPCDTGLSSKMEGNGFENKQTSDRHTVHLIFTLLQS